jgi:hypothetical protein
VNFDLRIVPEMFILTFACRREICSCCLLRLLEKPELAGRMEFIRAAGPLGIYASNVPIFSQIPLDFNYYFGVTFSSYY